MNEIRSTMPEPEARREPIVPRRSAGRSFSSPVSERQEKQVQAATVPKRNIGPVLRRWHQRGGVFAFLFMGWLGISGVLLNQSASWGLDAKRIDWPWLMALYGLHSQPPESGFAASGGHWLAIAEKSVLLDGKLLQIPLVETPIGLVSGGDPARPLLFIAMPSEVLVTTAAGERVDELQVSLTLPVKSVSRIGAVAGTDARVAIEGESSSQFVSKDGESWTALPAGSEVQWSQTQPLTDGQRQQAEPFSRPTVALEQILVDTHSGRLFGRFGPYVIDAVGLVALWLAISGIWMTWRNGRRRRA